MRPYGSPKALEKRRRKAIALLESGLSIDEVGRQVGASFVSVYRWREARVQGGDKALASKPVPGRPRKLDNKEIQALLGILLKGALDYGFPNDIWTLKRMALVIRKVFGVRYHPCHVWKLLRNQGWSCQVPEKRAVQRDEEAIEHWKRYKWPAIKKKVPRTWCPPRLPR